MMSDRAETSMSFSGIAGGMRGVLAGVSKGKRAGERPPASAPSTYSHTVVTCMPAESAQL